jgi:hypothetical protein
LYTSSSYSITQHEHHSELRHDAANGLVVQEVGDVLDGATLGTDAEGVLSIVDLRRLLTDLVTSLEQRPLAASLACATMMSVEGINEVGTIGRLVAPGLGNIVGERIMLRAFELRHHRRALGND